MPGEMIAWYAYLGIPALGVLTLATLVGLKLATAWESHEHEHEHESKGH
jgi:hypothetical protein